VPSALRRAGHEVTISLTFGAQGWVGEYDGMRVLPVGPRVTLYGQELLGMHARAVRADVVWSLIDVFIFDPSIWRNLPWAAWLPIDAEPLMVRNRALLDVCRWPIAMSRFGHGVLQAAGYNPYYVPHMYDPARYWPEPRGAARNRLAAEWRMALGERFLVCVNSANCGAPSRKNFGAIFEGFALFARTQPNALLYLHTDTTGVAQQGEPLQPLLELYGVNPRSVIVPDHYRYMIGEYDTGYLRAVYSAADVLLNPSHGEGFGLPALEAQACGCPVLLTDFSASRELCFAGRLLPGTMQHTSPGAQQCIVSGAAVAEGLEWIAASDRDALRQAAIEGARTYRTEAVMGTYMLPVLRSIEDQVRGGVK